jgi:hypothetical protein
MAVQKLLDGGDRDLPTKHEDSAGAGIIGQRQCLLQAQLLTATIKAIRAVNTLRVVVAARAILHGPQLLWALLGKRATGKLLQSQWWSPSHYLLPPSRKVRFGILTQKNSKSALVNEQLCGLGQVSTFLNFRVLRMKGNNFGKVLKTRLMQQPNSKCYVS